jgi:proton-dependent oligopeptide transporter, POT family
MTAPHAGAAFFGHPRSLSTLFFTELWERFSYYGMRAILVLFLVEAVARGGFGLADRDAAAIYGLYTAGVYLASLPGGWIADRVLGGQAALAWGAAIITLGHLLLALSGSSLALFCTGLAVIVAGTGLMKPNIAALVAGLYPEGGARRDAGFTVFYIAINLGGLLGPLVTAGLAQAFGWHVGFLAAAVGMAGGLAYFLRTRARLGPVGLPPPHSPQRRRAGRGALWGMALLVGAAVAFGTGLVPASPVALQGGSIWLILAMSLGFFIYLLGFAGLTPAERRSGLVLLALCAASAVFWSGFEQAGSSLNLFAQRYTDRVIGALEIPAGWFQSLNSLFIILFAPLFSALWIGLGRRHLDPSAPLKFVFGLAGMAVGFLVMMFAARIVAGGALAGAQWLVLTYLLHTWGELCLSPIGMSAATQLVPARFTGQSMGIWYASLSLGNLVASRLAGDFDPEQLQAMPGQYLDIAVFGGVAAAVLLIATPRLARWAAATPGSAPVSAPGVSAAPATSPAPPPAAR